MLDRELLRRDPERVRESLRRRRGEVEIVDRFLRLDSERRDGLQAVEDLKRQRNELSRAVGEKKRRAEGAEQEIAAVGVLKGKIEQLESRLGEIEGELAEVELSIPNLLSDTLPEGSDESANRIERLVGEPPTFDFEPQAHWDLGPALGILDFERGAKVAGARFTAYFGLGARLERALVSFMLDLHTGQHGYIEVLPPFLINRDALVGTGQLPKFAADLFKIEGHELYLTPTAEVPVTNLHRGELLDEAQLPIRYAAYTPCFRSEAGSHGRDVRGLIRQHQFNKVELVQLVAPEASEAALEELTGHAEAVLEALELPYRRVTLATGDTSFSSSKTYDLEVWLAGQGTYREISSCSNFLDFQARRASLRYRSADGGKPRFVHTLNGSGLAVGRTVVALLEAGQQGDGSVTLPEVLRPYLGGVERIAKPT